MTCEPRGWNKLVYVRFCLPAHGSVKISQTCYLAHVFVWTTRRYISAIRNRRRTAAAVGIRYVFKIVHYRTVCYNHGLREWKRTPVWITIIIILLQYFHVTYRSAALAVLVKWKCQIRRALRARVHDWVQFILFILPSGGPDTAMTY